MISIITRPPYNVFFRDQLRNARNRAIDDVENFDELLYAFERLGCFLSKKIGDLGQYKKPIVELAEKSCLAIEVPSSWHEWHLEAARLFEIVQEARNDALHQGAFARHLTTRAIELSIVLEDALMTDAEKVVHYMVRDPVCAYLWQPISFIRQQMLAHSFSYLPVPVYVEEKPAWKLVSDLLIAKYLRSVSKNERKKRLAKSLQEAIKDGLEPLDAQCFYSDDDIDKVISKLNALPILICHSENQKDLIGILTPFDLL